MKGYADVAAYFSEKAENWRFHDKNVQKTDWKKQYSMYPDNGFQKTCSPKHAHFQQFVQKSMPIFNNLCKFSENISDNSRRFCLKQSGMKRAGYEK